MLESVFNLETFTKSKTAKDKGLDNTKMTDEQFENLKKLHKLFLEIQHRLSAKFAKPIQIRFNSVFRSVEVNKAIRGSTKSQHMDGTAADSVAIGINLEQYYQALRELAKEKVLQFGQVMIEYGKEPNKESDDWLHVSLPDRGILNDFRRCPILKEDGAKVSGKRDYIKDPL